ncbi:Na+/H+ antiporter subunit C [Sulfurimonas sediminis]|uniref:Na+/H+ antiporter subunit C n=1 Tax=Sulfurimonas sediminis TaxID=2590020 RepID=A0A7M1AZV0_9BACT|nr:NADH-quinone oxidoreductase subunit K [Sulfurimonas sediminis]QOP42991.1 Na+/H+ antiporter subunit C [Sulfurimonas sediminis]
MNTLLLYPLTGIGLFCIGLYALILQPHLLRKLLAINIMGSGVFLLLVSLSLPGISVQQDPVPQAMVITGIVVAISATALALVFMIKIAAKTGKAELSNLEKE